MSGWAELVGQQIAAQQGAEALARAARGESYGDVTMEGPRIGYRAEERAPRQLPERHVPAPPQLRPPASGQALTARDQETLWLFCQSAADLMADMGARFSPPDVARILSRLTSEGWVIDVDRQGR